MGMSSDIATLRARHDSLGLRSIAGNPQSSGQLSDDGSSDLHRKRLEIDVVQAMAHAIRSTAEMSGAGLAMLGTPQFARQLMVAQTLLEEWHQQELQNIREQGA